MAGGYSHYLIDCLSIIVIDLLLAGDNALVIALAVRALPKLQRRAAMLTGAWLAVLIRVGVTFLAAKLLEVEYVQFAGGVFVIWIAIRVLKDAKSADASAASPRQLWRAIGSIVMADLTMSTDNILAVAGASKGNVWLIAFGLALSIPLVVSSSTFLAFIMDKYPVTMYLGVAILGRVGGEMMLGDPWVRRLLHPSDALRYSVELALMAAVIVTGRLLSRR
ncbi:MAG TPA: YjbE family putative metal transport protein [Bryobacteraceae bacterium]|nr:YjbE family putative metal transport protein [Bryobacteraceae bacterium]